MAGLGCSPRVSLKQVPLQALQVIVAERGPLVWVFNFSPTESYGGLKVRGCTATHMPQQRCSLDFFGQHV